MFNRIPRRAATRAAAMLLSVLLVACGGGGGGDAPAGPPTGSVGPAGATIASADGNATLTIPAGALNTTIQATLTPATAADGYIDDPQIVPGTAYRLDAPDTALAAPAMLDIAVPAAAASAAGRARSHAEAVVASKGFLGCYINTLGDHQHFTPTGVPAGASLPPTNDVYVCVYDASMYPLQTCPAGWVLYEDGLWKAPDYFTPANPHTFPPGSDGGLGEVLICEPAPTPAPLLASLLDKLNVLPAKPAQLPLLGKNVFAVLRDKTPPIVSFTSNTTVIPAGNGMAKVHLEATASDNLGVTRVDLTQQNFINGNPILGQQVTILKTNLASSTAAPPYVWESAPMPVDQIYGGLISFYATAYDAAGNTATASKSYAAATPLITGFSASPSTASFGGQDVVLSWTTPAANSPNFSDALSLTSSVSATPIDVTGKTSTTVHVSATTTFTLTGTNPSGTGSATVTVQVGPQDAPTIGSFTATPASVPWNGGSVLLQWTSNGATALSITPSTGPAVGDVTGLTSKTVPVTADTTFTLTASNTSTTHPTASVHVTLQPKPVPTIASFTAVPATLPSAGGIVTLNWNVSLADALSISGIGPVSGTSYTTASPVTATTTYTLMASNVSGSAALVSLTVVVASSGDRFVDVNAGSDGNACTQAAPCKTIAKGLSGAQSGSTVWLVSGVYDVATQGANAETIPDGVILKAVSAGGAVVTNAPLVAAGTATINGIVLDRDTSNVNIGSISASSSMGTPTLLITGVRTTQEASFQIGGNVKATMAPGALAGGLYTTSLSAGQAPVVSLTGNAELLVAGGIIDGNAAYTVYPLFSVAGHSKLTLDGATIRNRQANAISATDNASVFLKNGALIDTVSGGIVAAGANTVSVDHSQISHYIAGIVVTTTPNVPTITITNSSISHGVQPGYGILSDQGGADAIISLDGATLSDNYVGIKWAGISTASSIDIKNSAITGNSGAGIQLMGTASSFKMRTTNVSNNGNNRGGLAIYTSGMNVDLGTQASPGGNTFTGNSGNGLYVGQISTPITIQAVGNLWTPNQQGADATGKYSTSPAYVPVVKVGPADGKNYGIDAGVTANL